MSGGVLCRFEVGEGEGYGGAAEEAEGYVEGAFAGVGCPDGYAFEAAQGAAEDAHAVAGGVGVRGEIDGGVGIAEHEAQCRHLALGNYGYGATVGAGSGGFVGEESVYAGSLHNPVAAHIFGAPDEYDGWYYDAVDHFTAPIGPHAHFALGGNVGVNALGFNAVGCAPLGIVVDISSIPVGLLHASGTVNALRGSCRKALVSFLLRHY